MTMSDRDRLIEKALMPQGDLVVPPDLATLIHLQLVQAPQRRRPLASPILRHLPEMPVLARPAAIWLTALLLLALAIVAVLVAGTRREPSFPPGVTTYHGNATQDGMMPGPGPQGVAVELRDVQLPGSMDNLSLPLVRDGIAYFADLRGHVTAVSAADLSARWQAGDLGRDAHAPVLLGPNLILAGDDGVVTALDAATGKVSWQTPPLNIEPYAPVTGAGDIVLVSSAGGQVVGLSAVDGKVLYRIEAGGAVNRSPSIADGTAYVASDSGLVTAFDVASGVVAWQVNLADDDRAPLARAEVSTPVYADGVLYVARGPIDMSVPHEVVALDVATRAVRWRSASATKVRMFVGAVTNDAVYTVGEDGAVRILDLADGTARELFHAGDGIGALPTVVGPTLYLSSYDGVVRAVDRHSGDQQWAVQVDVRPTGPVVVDGRVYVGTSLGRGIVIGDP